ncbi:T9SS type B sorting domain-containing protein [Tenacibaculum larymnensis]|uniref:T9SS type B sorting domain-containing protein n=1 Tax=Tenacibaculum larymnensis TaxID=2878201 RepID=A0A9X4EXK1_9FLAO|nr:T9SS type B sorting domain-containing protein [Tenacibaculum larymnensis]MDE1208216.1 T9SS type B sorting domain-containing protein [Tenacibaculum larymnensis]
MKKLIILSLLFACAPVFTQNDCSDAIVVCGNSGFQNLNATGVGVQELSGSNTCSSQENNSLWIKIKIDQGGTLGFTLTPTNPDGSHNTDINIDFDFFIFGPNVSCGNIGQAIRCSTTNPAASNQGNNLTGIKASETDVSEGPGALGNSFVSSLNVNDNDSYFLVIDRPIGSSSFKIDWTGTATFNKPPTINPPTIGQSYDLQECDSDGTFDNSTSFDLTANDNLILNGQTDIKISYHLSNNDAQTNTNPIPNPNTFKNTSNPQKIFIRLTNISSECFSVTDFNVIVNNNVNITQPINYIVCDDINSGSNTDGLYSSFLLSSKDNEILGTLDPNTHTVNYYLSLNEAQNNLNPINKNTFFTNTKKDSQEIFIRIENNFGCLNTSTSFNLEINPTPDFIPIQPYQQCDFDSNPTDGITTFNLESKVAEISNNNTNVTVLFFESQTDFNNNSPITSPSNYTNITPFYQKLLVKIIDNTTLCFNSGNLDLTVNASGLSTLDDMYSCELDINASNPNAIQSIGSQNAFFDFDTKRSDIITKSNGALTTATHSIEFYKTASDASLQINKILPPYDDDLFTNDSEIFVRIISKTNNACESVGKFNLHVENLPIPQGNLNDIILCIDNPRPSPQPHTVPLNAYTGNPADNYKWYLNDSLLSGETSAIHNANTEGEYKVEAYRSHPNISEDCMGYNTFFVKESNHALIVNIQSVDDQDTPLNNKIDIVIDGIGDYEYALNSIDLSDFVKGTKNLSYTFTDIPPGLNTISIRDRNGCGVVTSDKISTIYFQRHFTPNGDGHFDTWKVLGIDNDYYDVVKVQIFNRFGKLINEITNKNNSGWNGLYNGTILPSNDYWYNAKLIDKNGRTRKKTGHFSLLRK